MTDLEQLYADLETASKADDREWMAALVRKIEDSTSVDEELAASPRMAGARALISGVPGVSHFGAAARALTTPLGWSESLKRERAIDAKLRDRHPVASLAGNLAVQTAIPMSRAAGPLGMALRALQSGGMAGGTALLQGQSPTDAAKDAALAGTVGPVVETAVAPLNALRNSLIRNAGPRSNRAALRMLEANDTKVGELAEKYGSRERAGAVLREYGLTKPGMTLDDRAAIMREIGKKAGAQMERVLEQSDAAGVKVNSQKILDNLEALYSKMFDDPSVGVFKGDMADRRAAREVIDNFKQLFYDPPRTPVAVQTTRGGAWAAPGAVTKTIAQEGDEILANTPIKDLIKAVPRRPDGSMVLDSDAGRALARKIRMEDDPSAFTVMGGRQRVTGGTPPVEPPLGIPAGRVGTDTPVVGNPTGTYDAVTRAEPGLGVAFGDDLSVRSYESLKRRAQRRGYLTGGGRYLDPQVAKKDPQVQFLRQASGIVREADDEAIGSALPDALDAWRNAKHASGAAEDFAGELADAATRAFTRTEAGLPAQVGNLKYGAMRATYNALKRIARPREIQLNDWFATKSTVPWRPVTPVYRLLAGLPALEGEE